VLRRNPVRAAEMAASRADKLRALGETMASRNEYLAAHPRARVLVGVRDVRRRAEKLRVESWVTIAGDETTRLLSLQVDEAAREEAAKLDGCYVLKTDLPASLADKATVHSRYKDLALVEQAFRSSKSVELEMRPIHVRRATRTRGHALVVMLAYRIARELARCWVDLDARVQEGLDELAGLCATEILENGRALCCRIPTPRESLRRLLDAAEIRLPEALPCRGVVVSTKKKLPERRTRR
jgi:hypothetical protein